MDISREALLLYLRDLRDLEFAKKKISALYNQKEQYMKSQLAYMKTPKLQGENNKTDGGEKFLFWFVGGTGLFMTCFGGWLMTREFSSLLAVIFELSIVKLIIAGITILGVLMMIVALRSMISAERKVSKSNKKAKKHNADERARVESNANSIAKMEQEYAETLSYLSNEFNKVDSILTAYYSQNILPKQYRNIASLIYIYDYMSSSQESFSNALLHEHMEKGIQEILSRLDYIIQQNGYMIFNQHRIEAQNQNIISQNRSMLETLERTERNTVEANQYAQLSLNYSKTTAFFAAATYLEQK